MENGEILNLMEKLSQQTRKKAIGQVLTLLQVTIEQNKNFDRETILDIVKEMSAMLERGELK